MDTIRIKRGPKSRLPRRASIGELLYCTDTKELFIGKGDTSEPELIRDPGMYEEQLKLVNISSIKNSNRVTSEVIGLPTADIFTGKFRRISDVLPEVSLSDVQSLDPNATLEDSVDWFIIMKLIDKAHKDKVGYVELPNGSAVLSRPIDLTKKLYRCDILGKSTKITADTNFKGDCLIKFSPDDGTVNWGTSRLVRLDGLYLDGNFVPGIKGVYVKKGQEWLITNTSIHNCFIGVALEDTWYGEMSLENVIQDCIRGVEFLPGNFSEVNTIKFNNVKINCTLSDTDRQRLAPSKVDETLEDYKLRVPTVGIRFRTILGGVEFNGCTIEGQDIGFLSEGRSVEEDGSLGTYGTNEGIFSIDNCYLEAIKRKFYHIANITKGGLNCRYRITISNCRHFGGLTLPEASYFDLVTLRIVNCQPVSAVISADVSRTAVVYNDSWDIRPQYNSAQIFNSSDKVALNANHYKFNEFGNTNMYPVERNTYPSVQDDLGISMCHPITAKSMIMNHRMLELTNLSQVYSPSFYSKCGPVVLGDDKSYYMLQVDINGEVKARKLNTLYKVLPTTDSYNTTELWKKRKIINGAVHYADSDSMVEYLNIQGFDMLCIVNKEGLKYPKIMTYEGFLAKDTLGLSIAYGSAWVHLIDLDIKVTNHEYYYVDWYGRQHNIKSIGTISQRPSEVPTEAIGFKYIATDENKIYEWNMVSKTYTEFEPYNVD